jgi:hypothetical protein
MYYSFSIPVPHLTPLTDPVKLTLPLTQGVIQKIEVQFPRGTYALVHVALLVHGYQVWPTNPSGTFQSDGYTIPIDEYYPLDTEPFEAEFIGWSEADTYDYNIDIRIGILRPEEVQKSSGLLTALSKFLNKIGFGS